MSKRSIRQPEEESKFTRRFGKVANFGVAAVPILLYRLQGELGLSPEETWFISFVLSYKWDERDPYPSLVEISELSGVPRSTLQGYKNSLIKKGLLKIRQRKTKGGRSLSHAYDFTPLFRKMEKIFEALQAQNGTAKQEGECRPVGRGVPTRRHKEEEYKKKNKEETYMSVRPQNLSSPSLEEQVETELERLGMEPQVRSWLMASFSPLELQEGIKLLGKLDGLIENPPAYLFTGFKEGWLLEEVRAKLESKGLFRCRKCGEWTDSVIDGLCSSCYWRDRS